MKGLSQWAIQLFFLVAGPFFVCQCGENRRYVLDAAAIFPTRRRSIECDEIWVSLWYTTLCVVYLPLVVRLIFSSFPVALHPAGIITDMNNNQSWL